ncbi:EAL domain-containing protein [Sulfurospirillum barnesii]|uniref:EAL domain-containing protein n=1 Tax=Sulfurospirillum barnesii (strain ATCC 700032 / DSM 10660 / SES-3) TaxID=760154 RepID=I3XZR4_SULBS|nr:EAL domain-containing protein [Sulfurospirillum barnesii]AFL69438.1 EAL domain-containing protein [Sulfurospirillum barnesii SES-3]
MIENLIQSNRIAIYFQPIVSIRSAKMMGVEALMRVSDENDEPLSPIFVFDQAKKENLSFALDKHARIRALNAFKPLLDANKELLLFLNFESHLLDSAISFTDFAFCSLANEVGIPPSRIVIEIKEYQIQNTQRLKEFCDFYKERGFIIALDDFGAGNANFDRISTVRPHIVKVDRSLIFNVHQNFIHKEILKSIANMCFNIGALVLAEGVEAEEEILSALKLDIDLFQGFWFARPTHTLVEKPIHEKIGYIGEKHTHNVKTSMQHKSFLIESATAYASMIIQALHQNSALDLNDFLKEFDPIEAIYCIDANTGIQTGKTYISVDTNDFFYPAKAGDSHALKEYFYITKESQRGNYLSQKYISRASGRMCRTFAQTFLYKEEERILCLDLKVSSLS